MDERRNVEKWKHGRANVKMRNVLKRDVERGNVYLFDAACVSV